MDEAKEYLHPTSHSAAAVAATGAVNAEVSVSSGHDYTFSGKQIYLICCYHQYLHHHCVGKLTN